MNQPGNHGMLQPNPQQQHTTSTLSFTDNGNQHLGNDPGGLLINRNHNVVPNQMPMPPSSWGKCPTQPSQGNIGNNNGMMTSGDIHHSASVSPSTNSFGASSPFNPYQSDQQQQQHCFYPNSGQHQMEMRYNSNNTQGNNSGMAISSQLRSNAADGYQHSDLNNSTSGFFDTDDRDCRQYYPQMDQHHQGAAFSYDQQNQMKSNGSSCAMMSGHGGGGNNNFYGYYNQNSQYSHQGIYNSNQLNSGTSEDTDFSDRTHHNNANRYFDQTPHSSNRMDSNSQGYFNTSNYGNSQCSGRYTNSTSSPYSSHHHGQHPPFRRKSMESYISEPGDNMRYNSKYGCPNFSAPSQSQSTSQYCSPAPSPSSTMVKRECLSNPSSSIPTPPMSASSNCSGWTRNTNSEDVQMQSDPGHHSQDYLYTNTNSNSHQNQSGSSNNMNMNYINNVNIPYNQSSNENNDSFHQQQMASFKSCLFEQNDKMDSELKNVNNGGFIGVKAGSVKHRSLSLSVPSSSSSYPRNDIIGLSQQGNFIGHEHSNNSNDSNNTSGDYNSTQKVSESVSAYSMKTDSTHEQFSNYENPPITEMNQSVSEFISKPEECTVSSCNESGENLLDEVQVDAFTGESVEKVDENKVGGGSESLRESNCGSVGSVELCPSTSSHCDEEISNTQTSLLDSSPFGNLDDTEIEMVTSEKSFTNDNPPLNEEDLKVSENPAASNVISTTTNEMSCGGGNECDPDSESNSSNNSNCSFSSALFGKRANSTSCNFSSDDNDNESCASGGSFTFGGGHHNTRNNKMSPQKIAKRSFSETDKDMVINTTAISFGIRKNGGGVVVPKGWKREVSYSNENNHMIVYYVSPSDTKLRSWDELKNYICSDGTCKCGLSCPLRLESAFNFDSKVISLCVDKEDLMYLNESEESAQEHKSQKSTLCNHYKRKIPKSEDSPLISSTRDDLGDCPEKRSKKRRTSESEFSTGNPGNATPNIKESPLPSSVSRHVAVPCSQQSPDTTTQTPQTGMSPASSVSSEPSSGTGFNSTGGTRSLTSTPTPPSSSGKVSTPPGSKRQQGQSDFVWPPPPSTQTPSLASPSNSNIISWTSPSGTSNNSSNPSKKSSCHHLIPKGNKRANSPCPNIDVRQIPPEQNRPPPKPGIDSSIETLSTATTVTPSQPTFNANFSFFPVTSAPNEMTNISMNLNSGFTISPIVQTNTGNTMTVFSTPQISQALPSTNMSCTIPLEIQKIINPGIADQTNTFIPQFQPPVVLSVVGQPQQIVTRPEESAKESISEDINTLVDSSLEKSPLQLVQDVVNRFETKIEIESCSKDASMENEKRLQISTDVGKDKDVGDKEEKSKTEMLDGQSCTISTGDKSDSSSAPIVNINDTNSATPTVKDASNKATCGNSTNKADDKIKTEPKVDAGTTVVNTTTVSIAPMDHSTITVPTGITSMGNTISTFTVPTSTTQQIILQAPQTSDVQTANGNFISSTGQQTTRYPIIQTIQPFFLNQAGGAGGQFIISPQSQTHQTDSITQQSFIYHDPQQISHQQHNPGDHGMQSMIHPTTTMLFDPNICANNPNFGGMTPGGKKKKKRLSKKQQQQQAQLQLQQQLLLQQIHQAQQQQAAAAYTIFPQSFNLGPQGFSLQPMNFFQTPTILTLPNLILNPADGTLFLQPSGQLSTTATPVQNTVKFPLTTTTTLTPSQPQQIQQHPNPIAPKKDSGTTIINVGGAPGQILEVGKAPSDAGSDDSRRNPTPDSSTGDIQLGILNASNTNQQPGNTIISIAPHPTTTTIIPTTNKKVSTKSRAVSSSSTVKRILDSTTPTIENN